MRRRGLIILATALLVAAVVGISLRASWPGACPAVGYAYSGDVELVFSSPPQTVEACIGVGCTPVAVIRNGEGRWLVPQSAPYLTAPASVTSIHVRAAASSGSGVAEELPIKTRSTGESPYGPACGGPFEFEPVQVTFS